MTPKCPLSVRTFLTADRVTSTFSESSKTQLPESTMTAKLLLALALMATTAGAGWAAPIKPEVPAVAKFHEAMTGTVKPEMIPKEEFPEVLTTETGVQTEDYDKKPEDVNPWGYTREFTFTRPQIAFLAIFFTFVLAASLIVYCSCKSMIRTISDAIRDERKIPDKDLERGVVSKEKEAAMTDDYEMAGRLRRLKDEDEDSFYSIKIEAF